MKTRTFDLRMYEFREFVKLAEEYILEEVSHDGQGLFFFNILEGINEEEFKMWSRFDLVVVLVIDGKGRRKIPLRERSISVEYFDAAFIVY